MELICILIAMLCALYGAYANCCIDKLSGENLLLRESLHKLASGDAVIYYSSGTLHIEETK